MSETQEVNKWKVKEDEGAENRSRKKRLLGKEAIELHVAPFRADENTKVLQQQLPPTMQKL